MVADGISNRRLYETAWPVLEKAFDFLEQCHAQWPANGRYDIDGDDVYAIVSSYPASQCVNIQWEIHRKYVDLQYVESGIETIGWARRDTIAEPLPFDESCDCGKISGETGSDVVLQRGTFALLFPQDLHRPMQSGNGEIRKVIVKIRTDLIGSC